MQLVNKTKARSLALSLSLSAVSAASLSVQSATSLPVLSAACLVSVLTIGVQPALAQDAATTKTSADSAGQAAPEAAAKESKAGHSAKRTMTIQVPIKDTSGSESDFEARLRAEAIAAEARQNEAVQHYDASRVYLAGGNTEMAELELQAAIMDGPNIKAFHRD